MWWFENRTMEFVREIIGAEGKFAADIPMENASDANPILLSLEKTLCENEIGRYVHLGKVFSNVIESYMATIQPGDTEKEIAGRLGAKMWENGLEPVLLLIAADDRIYKYRHPIPTDKKLEKLLMISCNARYKGLVTKITRMLHFGKISPEFLEQYKQTIDIENAMAAATKPGVDEIVPYNIALKMYEEFGYPEMWKVHHQGGPQSYTNGFYLITPTTHNVVKLHQCYGFNPSITGTKTEDGFVVTEEGPLFITYPVTFPAIKSVIDGVEYVRPGILEI
jgi:Xaa-Pro dipeptidase